MTEGDVFRLGSQVVKLTYVPSSHFLHSSLTGEEKEPVLRNTQGTLELQYGSKCVSLSQLSHDGHPKEQSLRGEFFRSEKKIKFSLP